MSRSKGTSLQNYVPNSELQQFGHGTPHVHRCRVRQTSDSRRSLLTTPGDDGGRGNYGQQSTDDRRLLIILSVQLSVQRRTMIHLV